jgi:hydrogenase/urease accessory protein HupE
MMPPTMRRLSFWRIGARLATALLAASSALPAEGHEVRPAYMSIQASGGGQTPDRFLVTWRKPVDGEVRLDIEPVLPSHCADIGETTMWLDSGIEVTQRLVSCPGGIDGHDVRIAGLEATVTDVLMRYERRDATTQVARLTPDQPDVELTAAESRERVAITYAVLGIEHILGGIDHLCFVLALLMIVDGWRRLVATITAFTAAHSITLIAATLGLVSVPQRPVEAVIALSIVFVAMEIVHWRSGHPNLTRSAPWVVAFAFGLLHGFGFAGALSDVGLPAHAVPTALLFFNLGVEIGQLLFVGALLAVWAALRRLTWPRWAWRVPVYAIGVAAAFWTVERISGFG